LKQRVAHGCKNSAKKKDDNLTLGISFHRYVLSLLFH
jgi:hypothetical protein